MDVKRTIGGAELILNEDGSIYHLHLKPGEVAETIITVGDPGRVDDVSKHFDNIQHKSQYREFISHTGYLNNKHLTVISTGIGTDNIDIVMNELDALFNIDLKTRTVKDELTSLNIIRLGTSGSVNEEIDLDSIIMSEFAIGLDGLLNFYVHENSIWETVYLEAFGNHIKPHFDGIKPYMAGGSEKLLNKFEHAFNKATTISLGGFYGPQGRALRAKNEFEGLVNVLNRFRHKHFRISNLEMETSGIYGMGKVLGHQCLSVSAILADRTRNTFSPQPKKVVEKMIEQALEIITA
jgi:uridine phosphorylase